MGEKSELELSLQLLNYADSVHEKSDVSLERKNQELIDLGKSIKNFRIGSASLIPLITLGGPVLVYNLCDTFMSNFKPDSFEYYFWGTLASLVTVVPAVLGVLAGVGAAVHVSEEKQKRSTIRGNIENINKQEQLAADIIEMIDNPDNSDSVKSALMKQTDPKNVSQMIDICLKYSIPIKRFVPLINNPMQFNKMCSLINHSIINRGDAKDYYLQVAMNFIDTVNSDQNSGPGIGEHNQGFTKERPYRRRSGRKLN